MSPNPVTAGTWAMNLTGTVTNGLSDGIDFVFVTVTVQGTDSSFAVQLIPPSGFEPYAAPGQTITVSASDVAIDQSTPPSLGAPTVH